MHPGGMNPWVAMWAQPRIAIRAVIQSDPKRGIYCLSAIYAFHLLFIIANFYSMGLDFSVQWILFAILVLSFPLGAAWLYYSGWVLYFTGRWLKGKAPAAYLRSARAWSSVPYTVSAVMWMILIVGNAELLFIQSAKGVSLVFINFITLILSIWSYVLLIQSVREVQAFSAMRAFVNVLLYVIISSALLFFVWMILGFVFYPL